jgi:hypothetical protein
MDNNINSPTRMSTLGALSSSDEDEQFILDIIKTTKIESIQQLIDSLRIQESKSIILIRMLERYKQAYSKKDVLK